MSCPCFTLGVPNLANNHKILLSKVVCHRRSQSRAGSILLLQEYLTAVMCYRVMYYRDQEL